MNDKLLLTLRNADIVMSYWHFRNERKSRVEWEVLKEGNKVT